MLNNPHSDKKLLEVLEAILLVQERGEKTSEHILHELRAIKHELAPRSITRSIANVFSGDSNMANNVLVLNVGQTSIDTITPLQADGVTPSGGALSNVVVTFSDPSATFVLNADNTITFTGVAPTAGGTPVSGLTACTVTDTDGAVAQFSQSFTVLVNAVTPPPPPTQITQSIANVFSVPTP